MSRAFYAKTEEGGPGGLAKELKIKSLLLFYLHQPCFSYFFLFIGIRTKRSGFKGQVLKERNFV